MRAVEVEHTGGPEALRVVERPVPVPAPGEVLVHVEAAGVNYIDTYHRTGLYPLPLPFVVGSEGAGRISALGPGVTQFEVGALVAWKGAPGSYAEQVVVSVAEAVPVPDGVDAQTAAAVMLQGLTAHYLCTSSYPVQAGDVVVVHAAAGGVGLLLTQMIHRLGGRVIATTSTPAKAAAARAAGAELTVGYDEFVTAARDATGGEGVPAVFDGVGRATFDAGLTALRPRGVMVLFGAASGPVPALDLQRLAAGGSLYVTRPTLASFTRTPVELRSRTDDVFGWIAAGELDVHIGGRYALDDARRAHEDLESRATSGKLLIIP